MFVVSIKHLEGFGLSLFPACHVLHLCTKGTDVFNQATWYDSRRAYISSRASNRVSSSSNVVSLPLAVASAREPTGGRRNTAYPAKSSKSRTREKTYAMPHGGTVRPQYSMRRPPKYARSSEPLGHLDKPGPTQDLPGIIPRAVASNFCHCPISRSGRSG